MEDGLFHLRDLAGQVLKFVLLLFQMRKMISHSSQNLMCMDDDGQKYPHGHKWNKDDCTRCKCKVSK